MNPFVIINGLKIISSQKGGLGAQKVKTNFSEIENRAQQIDKDRELMAANKAQEEAKTKEEQEKQM